MCSSEPPVCVFIIGNLNPNSFFGKNAQIFKRNLSSELAMDSPVLHPTSPHSAPEPHVESLASAAIFGDGVFRG